MPGKSTPKIEDNQTKRPHFLTGNADRKRPKMTMGINILPRDQNLENFENFDDLLQNFKLFERPGNTGARKCEDGNETCKNIPSNFVKKIVENIEDKEKRKKKSPDVLKLTPLKLESKPKINGGGVSKKKPIKTVTPNQKQVNFWRNFLTPTGGKSSREMQPNYKANLAATFNPFLTRLSHSSRIEAAGQSDEGRLNVTEFQEPRPCDRISHWKRSIDGRNLDQQESPTGNVEGEPPRVNHKQIV